MSVTQSNKELHARESMRNTGTGDKSFFSLSRQQTSMLKGVGIVIMLFHHLIYLGYFRGWYTNIPDALLEAGILAKICVAFFAFTTGYGLCSKCITHTQSIAYTAFRQWVRFWPLFLFYVFLICCLYWCIDGCIGPLSGMQLLCQCIGWVHFFENYWYAGAFLLQIVFLFPVLAFAKNKGIVFHACVFIILAILCPMNISHWRSVIFCITGAGHLSASLSGILYFYLFWSSYFLLGWAWCNLACAQNNRERKWAWIEVSAIYLFLIIFSSINYLLAFTLCLLLIRWLGVKMSVFSTLMSILGVYSCHMWLNHALIYSYWMGGLFFKLPIIAAYLVLCAGSFVLAFATTYAFKLLASAITHLFPCLWNGHRM